MDLSKLSDDDLVALRDKNMKGVSDEGLKYLASLRAPTTSNEPPPDTGFTGALKSSAEQIQADYERLKGKLGVKPTEEAEAEAKKHEEKAAKVFKPTEEGWLEAPWTKLKETAGGSLPYMVAPVAAGAVAGAAPVAGALGLGATAASMLGAGAASAAQFTGAGLSRQVEAGKSLEDTSLLNAAAAAIPQAALDVVGLKYIPGIQKIFRSVGQDITEEAAKKMLQQGTLRTAGQYIAGGAKIAGVEGATEAGQAFFDRLQAGLNISDIEARKEYLDNFIGGAALGAVASPFGVRGTRGEARDVVAKAQAGRDEAARLEQEKADLEAKETTAAQKEMMGIAPKGPQQIDVARQEAEAQQMSQEIANQRGILTREMERLATAAQNETDHDKLLTISGQAQEIQKQLNGIDPDNISNQLEAIKKQDTAINKQIKAAEKEDDKETVAQLKAHLDNNASIRSDFEKTLRALKFEQQTTESAASIDKKIQAKETALEKAKESGDVTSIGKIIQDIKNLRNQRPGFYSTESTTQPRQFGIGARQQDEVGKLRSAASGTQGSLFEGAGESATYPEYQKRLADEERQRQAKSQEVLDEEAILNAQQQEIEQSTGEKPKRGKYREEMTSDEYTNMLLDKLADIHTRPDTHIPTELTPAKKEAEAKRIAALDTAKETYRQKLGAYLNLVNEADELGRGEVGRGTEVYNARGDVAALGKKIETARKELVVAQDDVVKAIPEGVKTPTESGKASAALQDMLLLDLTDTIDSMRKGEWFGGPNIKMASGSLETLAKKARSSLDRYIQATITNINYARLAKGMDRLSDSEKADIFKQVDELMNNKIKRATGKKATELKEAELKYGSGLFQAAMQKAGFRFKEGEILTGFHRNEFKDVQNFAENLKGKYTEKQVKRGALRRESTGDLFTEGRIQDTGKPRKTVKELTDVEEAGNALEKTLNADLTVEERLVFEKAQRMLAEGLNTRDVEAETASGVKKVMPGLVDAVTEQATRVNEGRKPDLTDITEAIKRVQEAFSGPIQVIEGGKEVSQAELFPGETSTIRATQTNFKRLIAAKLEGGAKLVNAARKLVANFKNTSPTAVEFGKLFNNKQIWNLLSEASKLDAEGAKFLRKGKRKYKAEANQAFAAADDFRKEAYKVYADIEKDALAKLQKVDKPEELVAQFDALKKKVAKEIKDTLAQQKKAEKERNMPEYPEKVRQIREGTTPLELAKLEAQFAVGAKKSYEARLNLLRLQSSMVEKAVKTVAERVAESEQAAAQQTGLGLPGKKQTFKVAEKLQAGLPHQGKKVEAAFNFAKQYFKEWNAKKSVTMNAKQREALKVAHQKYLDARKALSEQFKNSRVHPRIAKIMNWMVTADEKTARYRKAQNLIIGLEEKMQQQVFAKTPKKQVTAIGPSNETTVEEKRLEDELGYTEYKNQIKAIETSKESAGEVVGRISEIGLAKLVKKMEDRVAFITKRLESQKAPIKDRESLADEKDTLLEQIKATRTVLNARRTGLIVGQAQEEKGAKRYKASDAEKKLVKEGKLEEASITPEAYELVLKAYNKEIKNVPTQNDFKKLIRVLAATEIRLKRDTSLTSKRRIELENRAKDLRLEINELTTQLSEKTPSAEEEAEELGIKDVEAYKRLLRAMDINFKPRVGEGKSSGIQMLRSAAQAVVDKMDLPKGLKVFVIQDLSPTMKEYIRERGFDPALTKGFITENGYVVVVAGNHKTAGEIAETVAHEVTGHLGVETVLGPEGMKALVNKITKQEGGVMALADKLGVGEDARGAYDAAINAKLGEEKALEAAVHEMIAHTAEKRPTKDWVGKANEFIKALVGEFRAALRRMGINLDTNTSDIYKILRDARKDFKEITPGAYKEANGSIQFSSKAKYNNKFADLGNDVSKIVHANKTTNDKVRAAAAGFKTPTGLIKEGGILSPQNRLALRTRYVDRFAPMEKVAEKLTAKLQSSLEGTQLMYYLRMFDQGINWVAQTASHGPMSIIEKKRADGKVERIIETKEGASLLKVSQALKEADVGDANAANQLFTFYLAAKRAKRVGLNTLNFGDDVTQEMLDKVINRINSDAKTKAAFEKAADIYNEYNKGLVEFGVQTGRFSKEEAAKLLKENDYVPFYRIDKNGDVSLDIGGANTISIGNVKDQPYLHELVGDNKPILDVFTSALQNTRMLTDMALRNLAARNAAFSLKQIGGLKTKVTRAGKDFGSGIYPGKLEAGPDVIKFKIDGVDHHAIVDTETMGIPADLLVKGLDGVQVSIPNLVKVAGYPAKLLRSFITRNPAYAIRQIARDSLSNAFTTGANSIPIIDNMKQLGSMWGRTNPTENLLQKRGILGGQVLGNASDAMQKAMLQIIDGKPGWEKSMAFLDHVAMMGDATSRVTSYNSFVKQGLSDMEATLAALEAMNFSKKGTSPSLYLLNQMVPFLNAQIQGMDVLYKAFAGKMPFADKLDIKKKIWQRGAMMAAFTMAYTAMSYDDDDYKNATSAERIGNWFIKVPGIDEKVKVPIPFEVGGIFKMLPEMLYSTMFKDKKLGDAASETSKYVVDNFVPSFMPTAIKPVIELGANYSFFTGKPIEGQRLMELAPGQRAYANTPEVLKALGEATNISPVKMEYLLRAYTGSFPLAILALANPVAGGAEAPEGRGVLSSTTPVIGAFFQPKDANGLIDKAYQQMQDVIQADRTFKNYIESGRNEEADAFLTKEADLIGMATFSGNFRKQMGELAKQERAVRSMTGINGAEKRQMLDEIKEAKIEISKAFLSARE
jgi:hypothetical protein